MQAALDRGLLDLRGVPGPHYVDIPPYPRPIPTLVMPNGAKIVGDGTTAIVFRGSPMGHDWAGIRVGDAWGITGVNFVVDDTGLGWVEQTHVLEVVGPKTGGLMSYCTFDHPVVPGSSRGDCVRFRGYDPLPDGSADKRIWDQHFHHVVFKRAARSGIAVYGALNTSTFHHLTFLDVADQDLDMETAVASANSFEWYRCTHFQGPSAQSALAVSLYPGSVHMHHCKIRGRGLDVLGGSHDLHDNDVELWMLSPGVPVVYNRKEGSTRFRRERYTRRASAGPGVVFAVAEKITAPSSVLVEDVVVLQETKGPPVVVSGVRGITFRGLEVTDNGAGDVSLRDAVRVEGTKLTKTTPVVFEDCDFLSANRAAVSVSGSYLGGVGSVELRDCFTSRCGTTLRQENVEPTATMGGISGPVTVVDAT